MSSPNCRRFFPTQGVLRQVVTILNKDSPSRQVVGIVPFDDIEKVLERCRIFPCFHPNAKHHWLVERVEPLWAGQDVGCGLLQVEDVSSVVFGSETVVLLHVVEQQLHKKMKVSGQQVEAVVLVEQVVQEQLVDL